MSAYYYHSRIFPTSLTEDAGNIDANYPVANLLKEQIARPWRSNITSAINRAFLDFGSSIYIEAVVLMDVNVPAIEVHTGDTSATQYTEPDASAVLNPVTGRSHIIVPVATSRRYVTLTMTVAQMSGLDYGNAGAMYCYAASTTMTRRPRYGFQLSLVRPQLHRKLSNGNDTRLQTGSEYTQLEGQLKGQEGEDLTPLLMLARDERVFLDLNLTGRPGLAWPVSLNEDQVQIRMEQFNREFVPFQLKETV